MLGPDRPSVNWRVLAVGGVLAATVAGLVGVALETWRFGWSDEDALVRTEREVVSAFDRMTGALRQTATTLAARPDLVRLVGAERDVARALFDILDQTIPGDAPPDLAVTVYGPTGTVLAWRGRPSEIPRERVMGDAALFTVPGPLHLRLVYVQPILDGPPAGPQRGQPSRMGAVSVERVVSPVAAGQARDAREFPLETSIATIVLTPHDRPAAGRAEPGAFVLRAPTGEPLLNAAVGRPTVAYARGTHRRSVAGIVQAILALSLLLLTGPLLDARARARRRRGYLRAVLALVTVIVGGRVVLWVAIPPQWGLGTLFSTAYGSFLRSPADFLLTALTVLALVVLMADGVDRWRLVAARPRAPHVGARSIGRFLIWQGAAGLAVGGLLIGYTLFLGDTIDHTSVDPLHFSLHPWNGGRLALTFGLLLFHAAVFWAAVLICLAALAPWRLPRRSLVMTLLAVAIWSVFVAACVAFARSGGWPVPLVAVPGIVVVCVGTALLARRGLAWYRRAAEALRLLALLLALLVPALLLYPVLLHQADGAKRRLVENRYAPQAVNHPHELQARLAHSLKQTDDLPGLAALVAAPPPESPPETDRAFSIWRQTDLATFRLTSAIEVYASDGSLLSRFALNFPEYTTTEQTWQSSRCDWEVFGEVVPFGSQERRTLHAERAVCGPAAGSVGRSRIAGAIVVHVMFDYRTLPFISSQSPYFELFQADRVAPQEGTPGRDVELVVYGWALHPIFTSGRDAWLIDEELFARIRTSREPLWTRLRKGGVDYHVYVANDRAGIYALGYPARGPFRHLVHLAEISTLAGLLFLVLVFGAALFARTARSRGEAGRALFREIRSSFYRRLFLAFVAASVLPALTLAFVIRAYLATQLRADVEAGAARTATVAQRVIEEAVALQQRGEQTALPVNDDILIWISQVIDQGVNIFDGPRLLATSERDLFASGLLPTRTPEDVYRAIVLQRLPSFVGEEWIGAFRYLQAAAPVQAGGREATLTVPLLPRQQEIEREIDDLDRGIQLAAVLFILLGAAIGYSMAEHIADPVKRLTRATRRIARGDFDARVAARSADELQSLVEAFNRMAAELKAQRTQLLRTHRLEAWAEVARQVAHEIKNPLTPIQLSAEHLLRVHVDRGEPLSPVLQSCVESILSQVRLLRQISAEFSSFASAPAPHPVRVAPAELVADVLDPYRSGLRDRITLLVDLPQALPPICVDRVLVARALTNIIENALHAMPGGGTLRVQATADRERVRLDVSDTGVGMDEDALGRVFEPYFSTRASGTGLGLTIAKRNIELNGGTIEVRSEKGVGTTVTLTFPGSAPGAL